MTLTTPIERTATLTQTLTLVCDLCHEPCGWNYGSNPKFTECLGCRLDWEEKAEAMVAEFEAREEEEAASLEPTIYLDPILHCSQFEWTFLAEEILATGPVLLGDVPAERLAELLAAITPACLEARVVARSGDLLTLELTAPLAECALCGEPIGDLDQLSDFTYLQVNDPTCLPCLHSLAASHEHGQYAGR